MLVHALHIVYIIFICVINIIILIFYFRGERQDGKEPFREWFLP